MSNNKKPSIHDIMELVLKQRQPSTQQNPHGILPSFASIAMSQDTLHLTVHIQNANVNKPAQ
jgi:hypothetical protein